MKSRNISEYLKQLTDKDLKGLIDSGLFSDLKLPELLKKLKAEIESRKNINQQQKLPEL